MITLYPGQDHGAPHDIFDFPFKRSEGRPHYLD